MYVMKCSHVHFDVFVNTYCSAYVSFTLKNLIVVTCKTLENMRSC